MKIATGHPAAWLAAMGVRVERDVPLGPRTWYGVGGAAEVVAHPANVKEVAGVVARCREAGEPWRVLGGGANLLVRDAGVAGVVLQLDAEGWRGCSINRRTGRVGVGGGHDLFTLVQRLANAGLSGFEAMAGIPGTVGGAAKMNAGGAFGDFGSTVDRLTVLQADGTVQRLHRDALSFGYRRGVEAPLVLHAVLRLTPADPAAVRARVKEVFSYKKRVQPMGDRSAGCAFKNPVEAHGVTPWASPPTAGQLIDRAGLKGHRIGAAYVSPVHGNFLAADADATSADEIITLIEHVQRTVAERFGVVLEREVVVW